MKLKKRVLSLFLAAMVAVSSAPSFSAEPIPEEAVLPDGDAQQDSGIQSEEDITSNIKFVQESFDGETGILTMALKIKPSGDAVQTEEGLYEGSFIHDGYFAFQTDSSTVVPITASGTPIADYGEYIAFVGYTDSGNIGLAQFANWQTGTGRGKQIGTNADLESTLGLPSGSLSAYNSGYMVTTNRSSSTNLLDCYLQFEFNPNVYIPADEDGYIPVAHLSFQCYNAGSKPAEDENSLYCNSIRLPETAEEAQAITEQFTVGRKGTADAEKPMAQGAAGYREKTTYVDDGSGKSFQASPTLGEKRYAFSFPVLTEWLAQNKGDIFSKEPVSPDEWETGAGFWLDAQETDAPQRYYTHMNDAYVVRNFYMELTNTFTGDTKENEEGGAPVKIPDEELDFLIPDGDSGNTRFPRYMVPTEAQTQQDESEHAWGTRRYNKKNLEEEKKVLMSYRLSSEVTSNSISRPEDDAETFFSNISWEFLMPANDGFGGTLPLNEAAYEETGVEEEIPWIGPDGMETTVTAKEVAFTEGYYQGLKFLRLYDMFGEFIMAAPLGVTLYWDDTSTVTYTTTQGNRTETRPMPQLHVTAKAADPESFLWKTTKDTLVQGEFYLQISYQDQSTAKPYTSSTTIRLYTAPAVVTRADIDVSGLTIDGEAGTVSGFEVGIPFEEGANKKDDTVSKGMITFRSTVYDQYGMPYSGDERSAVTFEPATDLMKAVYAVTLKGDNAFQVVPDEKDTSKYTIIYRDGYSVNDVVPGKYLLTASCSGDDPEPVTLQVEKDADYLAYMAVAFNIGTSEGVDENGVETIHLNVPELDVNGEKTTTTLTAYIRELANQWRVPTEQTDDVSQYDVAEGLRSDTSPVNFDLDKIRQSQEVSLTFEGYFPESVPAYKQEGIYVDQVTDGVLQFDSSTYDGVEFYFTVKASYQPDTVNTSSVEKKYKFVFHREESRLESIVIKAPVSLTVPTKAEGTDRIHNLEVVPYDQYGTNWNWGEVLAKYQDEYPEPWKVTITQGLDGVSVGGNENNTELRVQTSTLPGVVTLEAEYAGVVSDPTEIQIVREPSKALTAEVKYDKTEVTPPTVSQTETTYSMTPTVTVWDQYGSIIPTDQELYETRWSFVSDPQTDLIQLDGKTGKVTVLPCAPTKTLTVKMQVYQNGARKLEKQMTLSVRRAATEIETVEITEEKVSYPSKDSSTGLIQLHAKGTTQYGEGEDVTSSVNWSLESVTLEGGDTLTLADGGVHYDNSAGTYTITGMTLTRAGVLSFSNVSSEDQVPVSINVMATTLSEVSSKVKTITIERPNPMPYELILSNNYLNGLDVPSEGKENSLTLTAYVRDQYSLIMTQQSKEIAWRFSEGEAPQGLRLEGNVLTADSTALGGIYYLTVSYTGEEADFDVADQIIAVPVKKGEAEIGRLEFDGIQGVENSTDNPEIIIPSALSAGEQYTLRVKAFDNFGKVMGEAVTWTVEDAQGADVTFANASTGRMLVKFNDAVKGGDVRFTVRATSQTNPSIYAEKEIALVKGKEVPTYAKVTSWKVLEGDTDEGKPVVPQRGASALRIQVEAAVYSQYRNEMPGEKAEIALEPEVYGASLSMEGENQGLLLVQSSVARLDLPLVAYPEGQTEARDPVNSLYYLQLSRGVGYPFALELTKEQWTVEIPVWETNGASNVPAEETWQQFVTSGRVVDQYGAPYLGYYPVWRFAEGQNLTGIAFDETVMTVREDGSAVGKEDTSTLTLKISNNAVPKGALEKTILIEVGYNGDSQDPAFRKTLKVTLTRDEPVESYMYFENADETGVVSIQRPTTKDGKKEVRLHPVVYDQYGQSIDVYTMYMDFLNKDALTEAGYVIEEKKGTAEDPEGEPIIALYTIKNQEGAVIAEAHMDTGVLVIYPSCTVEELVFYGEDPALPGMEKRAVFRIISEETVPFTVEIQRENGTYYVQGSKETEEQIGSRILDQYGAVYTKADVKVKWSLLQMDAMGNPIYDGNGQPVAYDEVDENGLSKLPSERLLTLTGETERTAMLIVREKNFEQTTSALLQCQLQKLNGAAWGVTSNSVVLVTRPSAGGGTLVVTYYAGEYGKLVGADSEEITAGGMPQNVPGVKTYTGYGFLGWTLDGKTLVDPATTPLYSSTTYSAVYKDITGTKFVDGYEDGTFQPSRKVTRAEFMKMIVSAMGGYDSSVDYGESFKDIPQGAWYENYVAFAKQAGLVAGYTDGTFRPKDNISRAEAAKVLAAALKLESVEQMVYEDVPPLSWYGGYVAALSQAGIIDGYEDGLFRPQRDISRAESVKLIILITVNAPSEVELENIRDYAYCPFTDINRSHWAYPYILRATGIA
jgi:hypothetical protein